MIQFPAFEHRYVSQNTCEVSWCLSNENIHLPNNGMGPKKSYSKIILAALAQAKTDKKHTIKNGLHTVEGWNCFSFLVLVLYS